MQSLDINLDQIRKDLATNTFDQDNINDENIDDNKLLEISNNIKLINKKRGHDYMSNEEDTNNHNKINHVSKYDVINLLSNIERLFSITALTHTRNKAWVAQIQQQQVIISEGEKNLDLARQREIEAIAIIENLKRETLNYHEEIFELKSQILNEKSELLNDKELLKKKMSESENRIKDLETEIEAYRYQIRKLKELNTEYERRANSRISSRDCDSLIVKLKNSENKNLILQKEILDLRSNFKTEANDEIVAVRQERDKLLDYCQMLMKKLDSDQNQNRTQ